MRSGSRFAAAKVGFKSCNEQMSLMTRPRSITPGQHMARGTRQPPSQLTSFSPRDAVASPSGYDSTSAPLSVVKTTKVLSAMPDRQVPGTQDERGARHSHLGEPGDQPRGPCPCS